MVYCSAKLVASSTISNPRADKVTLGDDKPTMTFRFYGLLQRQTRGECNIGQSARQCFVAVDETLVELRTTTLQGFRDNLLQAASFALSLPVDALNFLLVY